jgi:hypothetical protein
MGDNQLEHPFSDKQFASVLKKQKSINIRYTLYVFIPAGLYFTI